MSAAARSDRLTLRHKPAVLLPAEIGSRAAPAAPAEALSQTELDAKAKARAKRQRKKERERAAKTGLPLPAAPSQADAQRKDLAFTPPAWTPARTPAALLLQLPDLVEPVPPVFALAEPVPLVIGVGRGLRQLCRPDVSGVRLSKWLRSWTTRWAYLQALAAPDSQRHDLDGQPVDAAADAHREHAWQRLERLSRRAR